MIRMVKIRPALRYYVPLYYYPAGRYSHQKKAHIFLIAKRSTRKLAIKALRERVSKNPYIHLGYFQGQSYTATAWRDLQEHLIEKIEAL